MHPDLTQYIDHFRRLLADHFEHVPAKNDFNFFTLKGTPEGYDVLAGVSVEASEIFQITLWMGVDTPELEGAFDAHRNYLVDPDGGEGGDGARWVWEDYGDPVAAIEVELGKLPVLAP